MSRFDAVPNINRARTRFNLSFDNKTSMSVGKLYPIYVQEIYPGDSFVCEAKFVARTSSAFLRPVMDVVNCDTYFFFVPARLVFDDFGKIFGESSNAWVQQSETKAPRSMLGYASNGDIVSHSVGDYLGAPIITGVPDGVNIMPYRAFALIYDEYFRDQNFIDPMLIQKGQQNSLTEVFNSNAWSPSNYMGMLPPVAKYHDYFTSCLPSPQKSLAPVIIPLSSTVPIAVYPMTRTQTTVSANDFPGLKLPYYSHVDGSGNFSNFSATSKYGIGVNAGGATDVARPGADFNNGSLATLSGASFVNNLFANPIGTGLDVSDTRTAIQLQKMLERDARGGTRLTEYITATFGVSSPDARMQRPEFLGGARVPLNVQQVAQTSESSSSSSLGELGAYSWTNGVSKYAKAFTEHGYVIGVSCLRYKHNYSQGWERFWLKTERLDYMDPVFSHLSEQPVYASEIFASSGSVGDIKGIVFGYNEIYADLRFRQNKITGDMRSSAVASQDIWHFGDVYASRPILGQSFIEETPQFVDRTLAVSSTVQDQFIFDWYFKQSAVRVLPMYGTPGLVDHG